MPHATVDLAALLQALSSGQVAYIIVGGMAAVLHGAPTTTQDLDIVPEQSDDNLDRSATRRSATSSRARRCSAAARSSS